MTKQQPRPTTLSQILKVLIITSALAVITQAEVSEKSLFSSCPAVDMAARAFAEGRQDVAAQEFEKISQDKSAPLLLAVWPCSGADPLGDVGFSHDADVVGRYRR